MVAAIGVPFFPSVGFFLLFAAIDDCVRLSYINWVWLSHINWVWLSYINSVLLSGRYRVWLSHRIYVFFCVGNPKYPSKEQGE